VYKLCNFCENLARDTPLWGIYNTHFGQISVKISVWGSYSLTIAPIRVKFGTERGPLRAKFHPDGCNVSPLWGEKPFKKILPPAHRSRDTAQLSVSVKTRKRIVSGILWEMSELITQEQIAVRILKLGLCIDHVIRHV